MRKAELSKAAAEMGRKGGRQYAKRFRKSKTPEERSQLMRRLANARWHPEPAPQQAETTTS
jgi:hypothetical protein